MAAVSRTSSALQMLLGLTCLATTFQEIYREEPHLCEVYPDFKPILQNGFDVPS